MKDDKKELKLFYCVNCGYQMGRMRNQSLVELPCPKCKKITVYAFREGQLLANAWTEKTPDVREPVLTM